MKRRYDCKGGLGSASRIERMLNIIIGASWTGFDVLWHRLLGSNADNWAMIT